MATPLPPELALPGELMEGFLRGLDLPPDARTEGISGAELAEDTVSCVIFSPFNGRAESTALSA